MGRVQGLGRGGDFSFAAWRAVTSRLSRQPYTTHTEWYSYRLRIWQLPPSGEVPSNTTVFNGLNVITLEAIL